MATYTSNVADVAAAAEKIPNAHGVQVNVDDSALANASLSINGMISVTIFNGASSLGGAGATRMATELISENGLADGSFTYNQVIRELIKDGAKFGMSLIYQGQQYDGWVMNASTYAATRYTNFNFNSYCKYQGKYYGCAENGVYLLDGDVDSDGSPIEAFLTTGNVKPFEDKLARMPYGYLLMSNDGIMAITIVTDGDPWTEYGNTINKSVQSSRIKLGKGHKSAIFQLTVANTKGCDFDIESFKVYPFETTRRI